MIDQDKFQRLSPLALEWAKEQEEMILQRGAPLSARQSADAERAAVQNPSRVRLLVVERILPPENDELADAASRAQILTTASRAVTIGHGIMIRADCWQDRELIVHQLVHVAQCERSGGLETFVAQYLSDRFTSADFCVGSLEDEARSLARDICAADAAAK